MKKSIVEIGRKIFPYGSGEGVNMEIAVCWSSLHNLLIDRW